MRKKIFDIIEANDDGFLGRLYEGFMLIMIIISMIPLTMKSENITTFMIDRITTVVFIIDYLLRLITADYKLQGKTLPFLRYPFTFMAIIDLLSILPSLTALNRALKALRLLRLLRLLKVLKVSKAFRLIRYSKSVQITINVIENSKESLLAVCAFAAAYIFVSALVVFNVEPDTFNNFFESLYWATVSLTTVGYGDIYPITIAGRAISMLSSLIGIAIVALPAGVVTSGYVEELRKYNSLKGTESR